MTLKRKLREQWVAGRAAAIAAMLLGVFVVPFPTPLERWSFDWLYSNQPATNAATYISEVAMIYMDDLSHNSLDQQPSGPWDRGVHAKLVEVLSAYSVKAIAFDIVFAARETNKAATVKLAEAIRRTPAKVVLAADLGSGDHSLAGSERMNLQLPDPALLSVGATWGFAQLQEDGAYAVREHFHGSKDVPSLSWRLATLMGTNTTERPGSQRQKRWLHYYGLHGTIPFLRYEEVLKGADTNIANFLRGRVVFVGSAIQPGFAGDRRDQFKTPYWQEPAWPGVDFHATQYLNLIREDWLRRPNPFLELFGIALFGLFIGVGLAGSKPARAIVTALVIVLLIIVCTSAAMWQNHLWFNWCTAAGIQVPVALAFSVTRNNRRSNSQFDGTTVFADATATLDRKTVADHEMLRCIGSGSYGEVWLARSVTGTFRAVKLIECRSANDPRLEREFAGLKRFEPISRLHPGLVHVLHVGRNEATGQLFYVMELADSCGADPAENPERYIARTLKSELQSHDGLTGPDCLRLSLALTSALAFLHEQGLIHRDIKPSNIIFVAGQPKLADIGLVAAMDETMSFVGTEGFIPPEGPGTTAADVYSLGKVLSEVLAAAHHSPILDTLHAIVGKATAQNVAHRYRTATEMLGALRNAVAGRAGGDDATQTRG